MGSAAPSPEPVHAGTTGGPWQAHRAEMEAAFGGNAASYDAALPFFATIADRLAEAIRARLAGPPRVFVDVAAGRGALAEAMAARCPQALTVASDLSIGMIRAAPTGSTGAAVHYLQADAELLPLRSGLADAVGCSTSLRLFVSPAAAVRQMRRVTRAGGVLGVSELGPSDAKWGFFGDMLRRQLRRAGVRPVHGAGRPQALPDLVTAGGYTRWESFEQTFTFEFTDELHWWEWVRSQSQGHLLRELGEGAPQLREAALRVVRDFRPIDLHQTVRFLTALATHQ
ncbi:class I SAM-dependent methyltransferase [Plantactinospora sp. WMMB334]|uniref:class I SAM-dependent methyltransferase n=1 Tax=Plantactinospora sp. WMMB334 TaxID=3404119 RepID=UPI003B9273F6